VCHEEVACVRIEGRSTDPRKSHRSNATRRRARSRRAEDSANLGGGGGSELWAMVASDIRVETCGMAGSAAWHRRSGHAWKGVRRMEIRGGAGNRSGPAVVDHGVDVILCCRIVINLAQNARGEI